MPRNTTQAEVLLVVTSLLSPERATFVDLNRKQFPGLHVLRAVDGYNTTDTLHALSESNLTYHSLCGGGHARWGKLAAFLTKVQAWQWQVAHNVPCQLTLDDDLELHRGLSSYANKLCRNVADRTDIVQMGSFGEARLTSLTGARAVLRAIGEVGIRKCDDQQFNKGTSMRVRVQKVPFQKSWRWLRIPNRGDIRRTAPLTANQQACLRANAGTRLVLACSSATSKLPTLTKNQ